MKPYSFIALFALLTVVTPKELTSIDDLRVQFLNQETTIWKNILDPRWNEVASSASPGPDVELTKYFREFTQDLEKKYPDHRQSAALQELENVWLWAKLTTDLTAIDNLYESYDRFQIRQTAPGSIPSPHSEWLDLAQLILMDPVSSVRGAMDRINGLIMHGNLFRQVLKDADNLCNLQQSPHQLLYNMYSTISLTEIKGYAMMQFSWMLLKIYEKGNFTQEANLMRNRFDERTSLTVASVKSAMSEASREMWRCDPPYHEEEKTYTQVTQLLQGYIENEVDMNSEGTCSENCAFYTLAENKGCFKDQYCSRQAACSGRIINCQYIDSDMWICPATRNSGRRYEWIEYENGRTLGRAGTCLRGSSKVDSWWRWLFWHCSYCLCLCDEQSRRSDRYFSLHESVSNVKANKVVTGLRFVKVNRIIHLQINEGVILPRGNIDQTTTSWASVHQMDVKNRSLVNGVDYHTMTYEERGMDLDDLQGVDGNVLTGVRFRRMGAHLHFEIQITPYNYTTGRLNPMKSRWESNDNTEAAEQPRTRLTLVEPDIPIHSTSPSKPDSKNDQFLEFTHSDFNADAAQTTVPFVDIQPVIPVTAVPLTGAGIYHKGQKGYGGFVAPKIFTYDYVKHLQAEFPEFESKYSVV